MIKKYVHSGYGIAFNGNGLWSFNDDFARNVIIFGVDISLSSHTDNLKNDFLNFGEGDAPEKKILILILVNRRKIFVWVCIRNFVWVCITIVILVIYL